MSKTKNLLDIQEEHKLANDNVELTLLSIKRHKEELRKLETSLVGAQKHKHDLEEQLRVATMKKVDTTPDARSLDIARFKEVAPALIAKLG